KFKMPTRWPRGFHTGEDTVKFTRQRYQSGSLSREVRKAGPAVWIFRWRENATEGRVYRKVVVGTIEQFPTKTAAKRAVETFRSTRVFASPDVDGKRAYWPETPLKCY